MKKIIDSFYKNQTFIYKVFLFLLTVAAIVYFFPKENQFKYEINKNKAWQHDDLYAPFDFPIYKTDEEIRNEKTQIEKNQIPYFDFDETIANSVKNSLDRKIRLQLPDSLQDHEKNQLIEFTKKTVQNIYLFGIRGENQRFESNQLIYLRKGNVLQETILKRIPKKSELKKLVNEKIKSENFDAHQEFLEDFLIDNLEVNVKYSQSLNERKLDEEFSKISYTKGSITEGTKVISKGEVIQGEKYHQLLSLKKEYASEKLEENSFYIILIGYALLVSLAILMLFLFIRLYRPLIYHNNNKLTFIFFNILLVVFLTLLIMRFDNNYIYVIPICILPITLKAFFDARLGLFTHVITVLIIGFIVPNSYEYMFLQIIAGIVTILTVSELYKRSNLFISVGQITLVYIFSYLAFNMIQEGSILNINYQNLLLFLLGGLGLLFVQPLIYSFEKIFGLISDLSLLELSDTNSKLLKELSEKAPGTFHHSLNVANLAEASANEIGANTLLIRVGALYHDIGKMKNPFYFTENQTTSVNPHNELPPHESAKIIIDHRIHGIEIAKKHQLPDRIIDFIRTHHGTTTVYYFYRKAKDEDEENTQIEDFQYPGPKPFSKETAVLMMCDSVEAASKSLREPTAKIIDEFVDKIIDKQIEEKQFLNADITFKEIESIKKILKSKLKNIFHLRIEYPE
ncbi:MAG: HD family phosphohydrolase [Bacteroidota bacterium]